MTEISYHFYIFIRYAFPILLYFLIFSFYFKKRSHFLLRFISSLIIYIGLSLLVNVYDDKLTIGWFHFNFLLIFIFSISLNIFCFKLNYKETVFYAISAYLVQHCIDNMILFIVTIFPVQIVNLYYLGIMYLLIILIFAIILKYIVIKQINVLKAPFLTNKSIFVLSFATIVAVYIVSMYRFGVEKIYTFSTSYLYDLILCLVTLSLLFALSEKETLKIENAVLESVIKKSKDQSDIAKTSIDIINMKCHDLKKQISSLKFINDRKGQNEMIDEIEKALLMYDLSYKTGNETLDVVLSEKSLICNQNKINIACIIDGEQLSFINDADLYSLFSNALDNAIEALLKVDNPEHRYLSIMVKARGNIVSICIENYTEENINFANGLPLTTKKDEMWHGFGVKSIQYIVNKYDGTLAINLQNNIFSLNIVFMKKED